MNCLSVLSAPKSENIFFKINPMHDVPFRILSVVRWARTYWFSWLWIGAHPYSVSTLKKKFTYFCMSCSPYVTSSGVTLTTTAQNVEHRLTSDSWKAKRETLRGWSEGFVPLVQWLIRHSVYICNKHITAILLVDYVGKLQSTTTFWYHIQVL